MADMRLGELVDTSDQVGATRSRLEKVERLAALIRRLPPPLVSVGVAYLSGDLPAGRLGVGYAGLHDARHADTPPAPAPTLSLDEVEGAFSAIKAARGPGAAGHRTALLGGLLARATQPERHFLARLIIGELRQGALEGVAIDAVARAFAVPPAGVRRATMLAGSLPTVAAALAHDGPVALGRFELQLFQPIHPMLADTADDVSAAWDRLGAGAAAFDFKLDGARVQVHKDGAHVEVYSRLLNRVTPAVPELVELVAGLPANRLILDGEAIALSRAGRPLPFQTTMRRFGRRLDVERLRAELPLDVRFFDILRIDDQSLLDLPLQDRWQALTTATAATAVVPHLVATTPAEAEAFLARAFAEGHEGLMAKSLTAPYRAGRRGQEWLKIKAARTFDLMVLAAEWGSGRRNGWLSNLHLGARDPDQGGYVMLGKTFKGMTDDLLRWQTDALLSREIARDRHIVFVRPELVAEIAFNDVQVSAQYPGGVALRFARLKRYRPDKTAEDTTTIADVRALLPAA